MHVAFQYFIKPTLLYQLVERRYPAFREMRAMAGRSLPEYIDDEVEAYLKCGRLEEGFLRVRCEDCHAEKLVAFSCKKRGFVLPEVQGAWPRRSGRVGMTLASRT